MRNIRLLLPGRPGYAICVQIRGPVSSLTAAKVGQVTPTNRRIEERKKERKKPETQRNAKVFGLKTRRKINARRDKLKKKKQGKTRLSRREKESSEIWCRIYIARLQGDSFFSGRCQSMCIQSEISMGGGREKIVFADGGRRLQWAENLNEPRIETTTGRQNETVRGAIKKKKIIILFRKKKRAEVRIGKNNINDGGRDPQRCNQAEQENGICLL